MACIDAIKTKDTTFKIVPVLKRFAKPLMSLAAYASRDTSKSFEHMVAVHLRAAAKAVRFPDRSTFLPRVSAPV